MMDSTPMSYSRSELPFRRSICAALLYYSLTSSIVFLGVVLGSGFQHEADGENSQLEIWSEAWANWDGEWYDKISSVGYSYSEDAQSSVAFFPAYPIGGWVVAQMTGLASKSALVLTSNFSLFLAFLFLHRYVERRGLRQGAPPWFADYTLLALGLIPTSFFFRMAYSESLFLLTVVSFLDAVERRRPPLVIAIIVGMATACRPVGIALILPFADHLWNRSSSVRNFLGKCGYLLPISFSGIAGYMLYLKLEFGEPLAFVKTQTHWALRGSVSLEGKLAALVTLEPIRRLFDPSLRVYWGNYEPSVNPLLSLHVFDYVFFVTAFALIVFGVHRRWLLRTEWMASALLLLIPFWASAYEVDMRSMGRYSSVAVPIYLVVGRILAGLPPPAAAALLASSGFLMGSYAALFASWHKFM